MLQCNANNFYPTAQILLPLAELQQIHDDGVGGVQGLQSQHYEDEVCILKSSPKEVAC